MKPVSFLSNSSTWLSLGQVDIWVQTAPCRCLRCVRCQLFIGDSTVYIKTSRMYSRTATQHCHMCLAADRDSARSGPSQGSRSTTASRDRLTLRSPVSVPYRRTRLSAASPKSCHGVASGAAEHGLLFLAACVGTRPFTTSRALGPPVAAGAG
jgi:hypothetical protein